MYFYTQVVKKQKQKLLFCAIKYILGCQKIHFPPKMKKIKLKTTLSHHLVQMHSRKPNFEKFYPLLIVLRNLKFLVHNLPTLQISTANLQSLAVLHFPM